MDISSLDYQPIILTLQLAAVTVLVLLVIGIPISWWLAHTRTRFRPFFEAIVARFTSYGARVLFTNHSWSPWMDRKTC